MLEKRLPPGVYYCRIHRSRQLDIPHPGNLLVLQARQEHSEDQQILTCELGHLKNPLVDRPYPANRSMDSLTLLAAFLALHSVERKLFGVLLDIV